MSFSWLSCDFHHLAFSGYSTGPGCSKNVVVSALYRNIFGKESINIVTLCIIQSTSLRGQCSRGVFLVWFFFPTKQHCNIFHTYLYPPEYCLVFFVSVPFSFFWNLFDRTSSFRRELVDNIVFKVLVWWKETWNLARSKAEFLPWSLPWALGLQHLADYEKGTLMC